MENIIVDLVPNYYDPAPVCHVSQYDKERPIQVTLTEEGERYELTGEEVLTLNVKTAAGAELTADISNTGGDHVIIRASQEMTAASGPNICDLTITDNSKSISTASFIMEVEPGTNPL